MSAVVVTCAVQPLARSVVLWLVALIRFAVLQVLLTLCELCMPALSAVPLEPASGSSARLKAGRAQIRPASLFTNGARMLKYFFSAIVPLFHILAVIVPAATSGENYLQLGLLILMIPFYALGARVAVDWIFARRTRQPQ